MATKHILNGSLQRSSVWSQQEMTLFPRAFRLLTLLGDHLIIPESLDANSAWNYDPFFQRKWGAVRSDHAKCDLFGSLAWRHDLLLPRFFGDTNYQPVLTSASVIRRHLKKCSWTAAIFLQRREQPTGFHQRWRHRITLWEMASDLAEFRRKLTIRYLSDGEQSRHTFVYSAHSFKPPILILPD